MHQLMANRWIRLIVYGKCNFIKIKHSSECEFELSIKSPSHPTKNHYIHSIGHGQARTYDVQNHLSWVI